MKGDKGVNEAESDKEIRKEGGRKDEDNKAKDMIPGCKSRKKAEVSTA